MSLGATEETFGNQEECTIMTEEELAEKLDTLKPQVISVLLDNTYLSPLHEKLATKAESLKHLDILYAYHSRPEVSSEIKQQVGHSVYQWYEEYNKTKFWHKHHINQKNPENTHLLYFYLLS